MVKVTKEKFYAAIGPLDVVLSVRGNYPYTTTFQTRYGLEKGRCVGRGDNEEDEYFLDAPAENCRNGEHILQQAKGEMAFERLEMNL